MEDNKLKTSSCRVIIKTFAIFSIILSSNAENYTPIDDSSHTTSSTSYSTKHSDDETTTHKHIQNDDVVTHTHAPISSDKVHKTTPHEDSKGKDVTQTHELAKTKEHSEVKPHKHIHNGRVITHTHKTIEKKNTNKMNSKSRKSSRYKKSSSSNTKYSKDNHLKHKKKIDNDTHYNYKMITESELESIVNKLSQKDKTVIHQMQSQIAGWPDEIFQEVRSYNEFIMLVTKEAKDRYKKLSPSAKEALEAEKDLKKNLSTEALEVLSTLHVENAY